MNKKTFRSIIMIGVIIIINLLLTNTSNASLTITPSKSTVSPGETFTVTVSVSSDEAGAVTISASNGTLNQTYIDLMSQASIQISCTAGSSGTISFSASGKVANYSTETEGTQYASASVAIQEPVTPPTNNNTTSSNTNNSSSNSSNSSNSNSSSSSNKQPTTTEKKSNNSKLSSLEIAEGVISPEFSNTITDYTISIPNSVTKLSISAVADSSRATVKITGNEELQIGDNNIEIIVTAEDGSKTTYKILAKRAQPQLGLQSLNITYIDENGEKIEVLLNPVFSFETYEYYVENEIPYTVEQLEILGIATRENAEIKIIGNENLKTGENEIILKVTVTDEAGLEEQKTYTIKVKKEKEPVVENVTMVNQIKNWFTGIGSTISNWTSENFMKIIIGLQLFATITFVGLTIYFIYDYKNYKKILAKLAELNKTNLMERANVALDPEFSNSVDESNINIEENNQEENKQENITDEIENIKGKRFK